MSISKEDQTALNVLRWHWDEAYEISIVNDLWVARRKDNGRIVQAADPTRLRDKIIKDYSRQPVPRDAGD